MSINAKLAYTAMSSKPLATKSIPPNMGTDSSLAQKPIAIESSSAPRPTRSTLISRNVTIGGRRTSVRLEPDMWGGLGEICKRENASVHQVCTFIAGRKAQNSSLTAAIRVFVMAYFRAATTEDGHLKAGHGFGGGIRTGAPSFANTAGQNAFRPQNPNMMQKPLAPMIMPRASFAGR